MNLFTKRCFTFDLAFCLLRVPKGSLKDLITIFIRTSATAITILPPTKNPFASTVCSVLVTRTLHVLYPHKFAHIHKSRELKVNREMMMQQQPFPPQQLSPTTINTGAPNDLSSGGIPDGLSMGPTLDEPVSTTIMRDLNDVWQKLKIVLMPMKSFSTGIANYSNVENDESASVASDKSTEEVLTKLRDWDLWVSRETS